MHIHILGIGGTFMGSLAILAKQLGHRVTGADANVYPPMSTQLEQQGIGLIEGYDPAQLQPAPDLVVVGNAMRRGNPVSSICSITTCATRRGHNGCTITCCWIAGCWRSPVPMARPPPPVCWPGFWSRRAWRPVS